MAFDEKYIEVTDSKRVGKSVLVGGLLRIKCEITHIPISERNIAIGFSGVTDAKLIDLARSAGACRSGDGAGAGADVRGITNPIWVKYDDSPDICDIKYTAAIGPA